MNISASETLLDEARATEAVDITREEPILDGRYRLLRQLGMGGMGVVYEAERLVPGTELALGGDKLAVKLLRSSLADSRGAIERLRIEARAASAIGDPHIVEVIDCAALADGGAYVVMERLDGTDLHEALGQRPMEWRRVCRIGAQIAKALCSAHRAGVLHRDLKPENVFLITRGGEPDFVKILDFGIAKLQSAESRLTLAGELLGTPEYMSPEQCSGAPLDHRTDIYSLGVVLFEMLSGFLPFDAEDFRKICVMHITEPAPRVESLVEGLPEALSALVARCLEKAPDDRFAAMSDVAAALDAIARGEAPAETPRTESEPAAALALAESEPAETDRSTIRPISRPATRRPLRWAIAAAVTLSVAAAGLLAWAAPSSEPRSAEAAPAPAAAAESTAVERSEPERVESAEATEAAEAAEATEATEAVLTSIVLRSAPAGAEVREGDAVLGVTPLEVERPIEGRRAFTLQLGGFVERRIVISSLSRAALEVPLVAEPTPVATTAPRRARPAGDPASAPAAQETPEAAQETPEPAVVANRGSEQRAAQDSGPAAVTEHNAFLDPWDS